MKSYYRNISIALLCGLFFVSSANVSGQNMFRKINDFDGDGKADFAITRNENGSKYWYLWQSTSGFGVIPFGIAADQVIAGDYDGDGKWDFGVYREQPAAAPNYISHAFWMRKSQTGAVAVEQFDNWNGFVYHPFQQDYDGDGKTDPAVTLTNISNAQGIYVLRQSLSGQPASYGATSGWSIVRTGDMTGDGKSDIVKFYQSTYDVAIVDSATSLTSTVRFGTGGDKYLPADFDGDGKGDLTVFRESNGTWWWIRSSDNVVNAATFGTSGDVPVPADYDGDGKTDVAIWRPGTPQSYFWVYGSQVGVFALPWGVASDAVVRY